VKYFIEGLVVRQSTEKNRVGDRSTRKYRSYPLNPSATIYRSMTSQGQELVGVGDYDVR
jgi:hypothetical protein